MFVKSKQRDKSNTSMNQSRLGASKNERQKNALHHDAANKKGAQEKENIATHDIGGGSHTNALY